MSGELDRDLRTYMSYLDSVLPTISVDEVVEPRLAAPIAPPRRRAWRMPAGVAATVLLVALLVVVTTRREGTPAREITEPSPAAILTPTPQPSITVTTVPDVLPFVPVLDAAWEPLTLDPTVFLDGDVIGHVAVTSSGFVAIGSHVWTSTDGQKWLRQGDPFGATDAVVEGMVPTSHGLVAWGSTPYDLGDGRMAAQAAAWVSDDGDRVDRSHI